MKSKEDLSQKIYNILIKKKYNRGAPFLGEDILNIINQSITNNEPIKLIGYWGTSSKNKPNWVDQESCMFLNNLNNEIKEVFKLGIEFTFIFANSHGIHNGYDKKDIDLYIKQMIEIFKQHNFKYLFLDVLWKKYDISFEKITSELTKKSTDWWTNVPQRKMIEKNALRRNKKHSAEIGAKGYYVMRELEKIMFEKEFIGYIFHTFSDPKLKDVLPNMPTLYFWGTKKWQSSAPWFIFTEN